MLAELVRAHPSSAWLVIADEPKLTEQLAEDVARFETITVRKFAPEAAVGQFTVPRVVE